MKMAPLTAAILTLFVLLSSILADVHQAEAPELFDNEPFYKEVDDRVHVLVRRAAGRRAYDMYHGTSEQAASSIIMAGFKPSVNGMLGQGVYVSRDIRKAQGYPGNLSPADRIILKVRVIVGKVKKIDSANHPLRATWHNYGYDSAWVPPNSPQWISPLTENCVWDSKRVKVMDVVQGPAAAIGRLRSLLYSMKANQCKPWLVC
uniref:Uncharacterized protein LOC117365223 n=1 Tax=Geotrypetes seraphini TaxID=260995 RepID=A0A6P8S1J5_GEOSA|nr:uncharacterized protein LOC117365223 [Geotrypetes seraphini]XP_033811229.1 uncharacterized protein LOC117365223 [Geotrypetes seraphini]